MRLSPKLRKPVSDKHEIVEADFTESTHGSDEDDFYTMEELEQLDKLDNGLHGREVQEPQV